MTAMNIVHNRVKAEHEAQFAEYMKSRDLSDFEGMISSTLVKTGDREYTLIGEWESMDALAAARPKMIGTLDEFRHMLETLDTGEVTDPRSGEVVVAKTR